MRRNQLKVCASSDENPLGEHHFFPTQLLGLEIGQPKMPKIIQNPYHHHFLSIFPMKNGRSPHFLTQKNRIAAQKSPLSDVATRQGTVEAVRCARRLERSSASAWSCPKKMVLKPAFESGYDGRCSW